MVGSIPQLDDLTTYFLMHHLLPRLYVYLPALDHSLIDLPGASRRRVLTVALCHKVSNLDNGECWCVYVREGGNLKELEM